MYEAHLDMEIRKLRPAELYTLASILNISDSWKKLMSVVPKQGNVPKFNNDHISIIEQTALRDKRNAAQIFLDEWSTMERNRPTLKLLQELLTKAKLFRAADYVACDILKQERPKRPDYGPAASVDISDEAIDKLVHDKLVLLQNTFPDHLLECNANHKSSEEKHADDMPYGGSIQELSSEELPVPVIS